MQAALDICLTPDGAVREDIAAATRSSVDRLLEAKPTIVGIARALDVIPGMRKDLILHAGPPVTWDRMSGPTRGAVMGGLVYEGLAKTPEEAERLAASGAVTFEPCHHHATVGPMAGIVTASMPVWIIENTAFGNRAYGTLNEGLGKVLRYGAYSAEVIERLRWMERVLAPALAETLAATGRSTCAASSHKPCRWATRCTTATARPPRSSFARSRRIWCARDLRPRTSHRFCASLTATITSS